MIPKNRLPHWLRPRPQKAKKTVEVKGTPRHNDVACIVFTTPAGAANKEAWAYAGKVLVFVDLELAKTAYRYQIEQRELAGAAREGEVIELAGLTQDAAARFGQQVPTMVVENAEVLKSIIAAIKA